MVTGNRFLSLPAAFALLFLLVLCYCSLFFHLGWQHMNLWDESSYALNAQEMVERGDPIEVYLLGKPDLYNTKPPFAIWCMALSVKALGFTEKAVRLPSALFALCSALLLFAGGLKLFRDPVAALAAPLVLITSTGFISEHLARTGDTDAILAFWILSTCVLFYLYTSTEQHRERWLFLAAAALSFACLTKGLAGLTPLPGLLVWALFTRKLRSMVVSRSFYAGLFVFLLLVPGYYLLRDQLTPGYIDTVLHFELGGRLEQQEFLNPEYRPFYFYYAELFNGRLAGWVLVLPISVLVIAFASQGIVKRTGLFFITALLGVSFSLGISTTKLFWYDAPMYPLIAGVIGCAFAVIYQKIKYPLIAAVCFAAIGAYPFYQILQRNIRAESDMHIREAVREVREKLAYKDSLYIAEVDMNFAMRFYLKQDALKGHGGRVLRPDDKALVPGAYVLTCKQAREADLQQLFIMDTLYRYEECAFFRIRGRKQN